MKGFDKKNKKASEDALKTLLDGLEPSAHCYLYFYGVLYHHKSSDSLPTDIQQCLVETRGIEPRISACKADVFPLALRPQKRSSS